MIIKIKKIFIITCLFMFISISQVNAEEKKNILYISSGSATYSSTHEQMQGFNDSVRNNYEVYFEHMNSLKYPDNDHEKAFYWLLKSKLKIYPNFDLVILSDDAAAAFGLKYKDIFGDTPIILTSINNKSIVESAKLLDIECIIEETIPVSQNIKLICDIYKKTNKNLVLVTGPSDIYLDQINEFYSLKNKYKNLNFKNESLDFKSEDSINEQLSKFNKNNDILFFLMPTSSKSSTKVDTSDIRINSMSQIVKSIKDSTNAPIFTNSKQGIEIGMVGGYIVDLYKQGFITGNIINDYFSNKSITKFVSGEKSNSVLFSYKGLINNNINKSRIPKDSELIFSEGSIFNKYKKWILPVTILIIILIIVSIFVVIHYAIAIRANRKLKEAKKIAEEANEAKNNFIANISHELRTPVTVISSTAQLMRKNMSTNSDISNISDSIDMIDTNSSRLIRLINNIIDVTKSETGFRSLKLQNVEVVNLIESTVLSVVPFAKKKDINIIFDTNVEELIMAIDIDKIERIILNLISNAIKFSYNGSDILVDLKYNNDRLVISIKDHGVGIAKENIEIIFEKFKQIDNGFTRLNEGSGIGLSLVKSFVKLHDGTINVKSEVERGTLFTIEIPLKIIENAKIIYNVSDLEKNASIELSDIYK